MILKDWPYWSAETLEDVKSQFRDITRLRKDDITQASQLPNVFISGRRVSRIPSASNNVISDDKVGDFNVTSTYAYYLIDNAGTGEWVRVSVGTW